MKLKRVMMAFVLAGFAAVTASAQTGVAGLLGKPLTDPQVVEFRKAQNLDANGLSYESGVHLYDDGKNVMQVILFNKCLVNGKPMQAYKGTLPYGLSFTDTPETIQNKFMKLEPVAKGPHLVWELKDVVVEVAYTDEKKTEISFLDFSRFFFEK